MPKSKKSFTTEAESDPLADLEIPKYYEMNEVEKLKRDLATTKLQLAQAQLQLANEHRCQLLEKIDPKGLIAALDNDRSNAAQALDSSIKAIVDLESELGQRLNIDIEDYTIDANGRLTEKPPRVHTDQY